MGEPQWGEPQWGMVQVSEVIDLTSDSWIPSRSGHPGFVGSRLLPISVAILSADWILLTVGFVSVSLARFGTKWIEIWNDVALNWEVVVPLYLTIGTAAGWLLGFYKARPSWRHDLIRTGSAVGILAITTLALLFMLNRDQVSRLFLLTYFIAIWLGMTVIRGAARTWFRRRRAAGRGIVNVLVLGSGAVAQGFIAEATAHTEAGLHIVGFLDGPERSLGGHPRLGSVADLPIVLEHVVVDEVVVCLPIDDWTRIGRIAAIAEMQGKSIRIPMHVPGTTHSQTRLDHLAGVPVVSVISTPDQPLANGCKRLLDVVVAGSALLLLAPVMALIGVTIALREGRPVMFSQPRVGLHGRAFILRKFRTMVPDAEARLAEVAHLNERQGPVFKVDCDPRITRFGRLLRATSLDELPQLWNVLRGEMSLVGPRPPLPSEVERYDPWHRRRLSMKPGVTGLWQVSNRNEASFDNWVTQDLEYIDSWSVARDLRILARTIPAVIRLTGK